MTTLMSFSKTELAKILSALDGQTRKPANSFAAIKAIKKIAENQGIGEQTIVDHAADLLNGEPVYRWVDKLLQTEALATENAETTPALEPNSVAIQAEVDAANAKLAQTKAKLAKGKKDSLRAMIGFPTPIDRAPEAEGEKAPENLPKTARPESKQAKLVEMLKRPEGATSAQIQNAFGWQPHTVRGAISGAIKKKLGLNVEAEIEGSQRVYRIVD